MEIKIYRGVDRISDVPLTNWVTDKEELLFHLKERKEDFYIEGAEFTSGYDPYKVSIESIKAMCEKYGDFSDERARDFRNNILVKCNDAIKFGELK